MTRGSLDDRLENWAKAQRMGRPSGRAIGSAEGRYVCGISTARSIDAMLVDELDAEEVERAWSRLMPFDKEILRLHYIFRTDARVICRKLIIRQRPTSVFDLALLHAKREIANCLEKIADARRVQSDRQRHFELVTTKPHKADMDLEQQCRAVKTPADLRSLPGYVARIDPALVGLERVIWPYYFRAEEVQCSLTNCGARHKEGVIVQLDDGSVSNIGHICGHDTDKFSTKFGSEMLKMSEGRLRETMLPMLLDRAGLEKIASQVRTAYHTGQRWLKRMAAFSILFPDAAREVSRRFASGSSMTVSDVIQRSESEIDDLVASGQVSSRQAARYRDVSKGAIQGTGMLALTESKLDSLWRRTDSLLAADPLALEPGPLRALFADANGLPAQAQEVARACDAATAFFTSANFSVMAFLPMSQTAKDRLAALTLVNLDAHVEKIARDRFSGAAAPVKPLSKKQRDHWRRAGLKPPG